MYRQGTEEKEDLTAPSGVDLTWMLENYQAVKIIKSD